jgi:hypothetical protein
MNTKSASRFSKSKRDEIVEDAYMKWIDEHRTQEMGEIVEDAYLKSVDEALEDKCFEEIEAQYMASVEDGDVYICENHKKNAETFDAFRTVYECDFANMNDVRVRKISIRTLDCASSCERFSYYETYEFVQNPHDTDQYFKGNEGTMEDGHKVFITNRRIYY